MAWTDPEAFATYVGSEIDADADFLASALTSAESAVRDHCQRDFTPVDDEAQAATRRYQVAYANTVIVDDIADDTDLIVVDSGSTLASGDFETFPVNGLSPSGEYRPISSLERLGGCWARRVSGGSAFTVAVTTARWGWLASPTAVIEATMIHAKDIVHMRQNRFGVAGFGEFGVVRIRENTPVFEMLDPFRMYAKTIGVA